MATNNETHTVHVNHTHGNAFLGGFTGCLGVLACLFLVFVVMPIGCTVGLATLSPDPSPHRETWEKKSVAYTDPNVRSTSNPYTLEERREIYNRDVKRMQEKVRQEELLAELNRPLVVKYDRIWLEDATNPRYARTHWEVTLFNPTSQTKVDSIDIVFESTDGKVQHLVKPNVEIELPTGESVTIKGQLTLKKSLASQFANIIIQ